MGGLYGAGKKMTRELRRSIPLERGLFQRKKGEILTGMWTSQGAAFTIRGKSFDPWKIVHAFRVNPDCIRHEEEINRRVWSHDWRKAHGDLVQNLRRISWLAGAV
jgi:hypothetical protein